MFETEKKVLLFLNLRFFVNNYESFFGRGVLIFPFLQKEFQIHFDIEI